MNNNQSYNMPVSLRIIVVLLVLTISFLSILAGLPVAKLLNIDPSELSGSGFQPTLKTLSIVVLFASSQFLLIWVVIRLVHRRPLGGLGFKKPILRPLLWGTAIGMGWQAVEYLLIHLTGGNISLEWTIPENTPIISIVGYLLLNLLFLLTLNSLKEELVFRSYPIEQFNDYPKLMIPVIIFVSFIFAAVHHILLPFHIEQFVSRFTIALVLSLVYYRWRSIWLIAGLHNGLNLLVYLSSGNYKMGGLTSLTIANEPSPGMSIIIDFAVAFALIFLFSYVWKKGQKKKKSYFE